MTDIVPDACTLPIAERPLRLAEFDELFGIVHRADRLSETHLRLSVAAGSAREGDEREAAVRDLTRREAECCSFFGFTVTRTDPLEIRLDVEVPAAYQDVLNTLEDRAHAKR
jgi:hypothetical protein